MYGFDKFPYTDFHELNIDWLLQQVKKNADWIENFDKEYLERRVREIVNAMTENGELDNWLNSHLDPVKELIRVIQEDLADLRSDFENHVTTSNTAFANVNAAIAAVRNSLTDHETASAETFSRIIARLTNLETDTHNLDVDLADVKDDLRDLTSDYNTFKTNTNISINNLTNTTNTLRSELTSATGRITELEDSVGDLETDVNSLETTVAGQNTRITAVETSITALNTSITNLSNDFSAYERTTNATITSILNRIEALEQQAGGATNWQTRNMQYKHTAYSWDAFLTAIRKGEARPGDYSGIDSGNINVLFYLAKYTSDNSFYMIINAVPNSTTFSRGAITYGISQLKTDLESFVSSIATALNVSFDTFKIADSDNNSINVVVSPLSAAQLTGIPAYATDLLGYNNTGKLPFVDSYLFTEANESYMLLDEDTLTFATYTNDKNVKTESGIIGVDNNLSATYRVPMMVHLTIPAQ